MVSDLYRSGDVPVVDPPATWIHQICHDTGVTATEHCGGQTVLVNNRNDERLRLNASYQLLLLQLLIQLK